MIGKKQEVQIHENITQKMNHKMINQGIGCIIGHTGTGKTTLINMLCGTDYKSGSGKNSCTRQIYMPKVNIGNFNFDLIDTPGINSTVQTLKHAVLLRQALTAKQINTIFVVLQYNSRIDTLLTEFDELQLIVSNYSKKIVVLVSKFDISQQPEKDFNNICQQFQDDCKNIICFSKHSNAQKLSQLMYLCICNMQKTKLKINKEQMYSNFNIYECQRKMKKDYSGIINQLNKINQNFHALAQKQNAYKTQQTDQKLQWLIILHKDQLENKQEQLLEKYRQIMIDLDFYMFYIKLQKKIIKKCTEYTQKVHGMISYNVHETQVIKKCPFCGQYWVKVYGCNSVSCGSGIVQNKSSTKLSFFRYFVKWVEGKLQFKKNQNQNQAQKKQLLGAKHKNDLQQSKQKIQKKTIKRQGCGKSWDWTQGIAISDEQKKQLMVVSTDDEIKNLINKKKFDNLTEQKELLIDKQFKK